MQKQLEKREQRQLLTALHDLYNRCALAKLKVGAYSDLYDQFDDLLRQVEGTADMITDLHASPPRLRGDKI